MGTVFITSMIVTFIILSKMEKAGHDTDKFIDSTFGIFFTLMIFPVTLFAALIRKSK